MLLALLGIHFAHQLSIAGTEAAHVRHLRQHGLLALAEGARGMEVAGGLPAGGARQLGEGHYALARGRLGVEEGREGCAPGALLGLQVVGGDAQVLCQILHRKTVLWWQIFDLFHGKHACIQLSENFAKLDVIEFL